MLAYIDVAAVVLVFLSLGVGALGLAYARAEVVDEKVARTIESDAGHELPELRQARHEASGRHGHVTTPDRMLVRATRIQLGLSQREFAERIGTPLATLRDWEQARTGPPGAAAVLMHLLAKHPDLVNELAACSRLTGAAKT